MAAPATVIVGASIRHSSLRRDSMAGAAARRMYHLCVHAIFLWACISLVSPPGSPGRTRWCRDDSACAPRDACLVRADDTEDGASDDCRSLPWPRAGASHREDDSRVNVVYASDARGITLMLASLHSVLRSSERPQRLTFTVILPNVADARREDSTWMAEVCRKILRRRHVAPSLFCALPSSLPPCERIGHAGEACSCEGNDRFRLIPFTDAMLGEMASIRRLDAENAATIQAVPVTQRPELLSVANFARNHIYEVSARFPELGLARMVYLDIDTVVLRDIGDLYDRGFEAIHDGDHTTTCMAAVRRCDRTMDYFYNMESETVRNSMDAGDCYINAGVFVLDIDRYVALGIPQRIAALQAEHIAGGRLWHEGAHQPSFVLALHNHTVTHGVDERWNVSGLGWNSTKTQRELANAFILHWSGEKKPDARGGLYKEVWHELQRINHS